MAVGRARPPHVAAVRDYEERIGRYLPFRADEVAGEPLRQGATAVLRAEERRIRERIADRARIVALDPAGRSPESSERFAATLATWLASAPTVCFLVGGPLGLPEPLRAEAADRLSLGPLTLPHQLARAVLAEQLYRALAANAGHPYAH